MASTAETWSRRAFLGGAAACCTSPRTYARKFLANNPLNVYIAESGMFGQDAHFSTGVLLLTNPERHLRRIHQLRTKHNYFTNFRYSSNDRYRFPLVQEILTAELNDADTRFVVRVQNADNAVTRAMKSGGSYPYQAAYRDLFQRSLAASQRVVIHAVNRTSRGDDRYFQDFVSPLFPNLAQFYTIHYWENDLMQLAMLFTGAVHRDLRDPVDPDATKPKERIVLELKKQLGVSSFTALAGRQKFQVIQV
jgi:hypothetical protein